MEIYQLKSDGKVRTKGLYHIQNVNNYQGMQKGWIQRYHDRQLPLGFKS